MAKDRWGFLKRAVKKIKFLLDLDVNKWRLATMIGASSSKRRLTSFNERRTGLTTCVDYPDPDPNEEPGSARSLHRTISYQSEEDVDRRADAFISNFYKQLQFERQISLELRYYNRANSLDSAKSP